MTTLKTIDLTKEGEHKYTTYFYHKTSKVAYEVITNGKGCAVRTCEECGISRSMNFGSKLPKYISSKL